MARIDSVTGFTLDVSGSFECGAMGTCSMRTSHLEFSGTDSILVTGTVEDGGVNLEFADSILVTDGIEDSGASGPTGDIAPYVVRFNNAFEMFDIVL